MPGGTTMFKRMLGVAVIAVLVVGFSNPARAGDDAAKAKKKKAPAVGSAEAFKKLDANNDGKLDQDEFNKLGTVMTVPKGKKGAAFGLVPVFKKLDANNDGKLTPDEFTKVA